MTRGQGNFTFIMNCAAKFFDHKKCHFLRVTVEIYKQKLKQNNNKKVPLMTPLTPYCVRKELTCHLSHLLTLINDSVVTGWDPGFGQRVGTECGLLKSGPKRSEPSAPATSFLPVMMINMPHTVHLSDEQQKCSGKNLMLKINKTFTSLCSSFFPGSPACGA